ncbi:MAG: beta-lactamase family protein [Gemmatimonadetes bacterium]|nr:beta-lactamase family protein [Gemmatimonadota bacterium]
MLHARRWLPVVLATTPRLASAQSATTPTIVDGAVAQRVDSTLGVLERQGMSGVFLVSARGRTILHKGYGLANRATRRPFTPDVVVQIGSNTKDFTAVAILQLAERGKLSLGDRLVRWFPDAPADKRDITLAQLLDHTSGFEEYAGDDFAAVTRDQFVAHLMASALVAPPGREEHYSNPAYGLLAVIIERISGTSYDVYVRDHILAPLGLTHTGFLLPKFDRSRIAHGYGAKGEEGPIIDRPHATDGPYWNLRGNGGMLSTLADMDRFYRALFETETLVTFAGRGERFPRNLPIGLSGSDGTHFFLYERLPGAGVSYLFATNTPEMHGPRVRRPLERALGLSDGPREDGAPAAGSRSSTLPTTSAGRTFGAYMAAFNSGDTTRMKAAFGALFAPNPQAPSVEQRLATYRRMFANLGPMAPSLYEAADDTHLRVHLRNKDGEAVTIELTVEPEAPHRIVQIGITAG